MLGYFFRFHTPQGIHWVGYLENGLTFIVGTLHEGVERALMVGMRRWKVYKKPMRFSAIAARVATLTSTRHGKRA